MRSKEDRSYISGRHIKALDNFDVSQFRGLAKIGIHIHDNHIRKMIKLKNANDTDFGMDALQPTVTQGSVGTPVQFLQTWLPGFVLVVTAARKADDLMGIMNTGSWEDEQVVQGILERVGQTSVYDDYSNIPLASWNTNFIYRTVVRFEEGLRVGNLELQRAARLRVDDSGMKREAAALSLEITRNTVGFVGFNSGDNNTYGFLNEPGLGAYLEVAEGVSTFTAWSTKTFLEIQKDILTAIQTLRFQTQDTVDPETVPITLAVATGSVDYLGTTSNFGISVRSWLTDAYPKIRVVSAPQLNAAYMSDNVFYLYADEIRDQSTDGGRVWLQNVPTKFYVLGVQQLAKGYEEDFSNATAGAMCKRPYAVVRFYGI